ncbi:MAG: hypothetical protein ABUK13_10130, partial [Gammaproteobacteria bacterium]
AAILGFLFATIVPVWGLLIPQGTVRAFLGAAILCRFAVFICNARGSNVSWTLVLWSLVTPYLTIFIIVKAVWTTVRNQGIDWRGTHYPLRELKKEEQLLSILKCKRRS